MVVGQLQGANRFARADVAGERVDVHAMWLTSTEGRIILAAPEIRAIRHAAIGRRSSESISQCEMNFAITGIALRAVTILPNSRTLGAAIGGVRRAG